MGGRTSQVVMERGAPFGGYFIIESRHDPSKDDQVSVAPAQKIHTHAASSELRGVCVDD